MAKGRPRKSIQPSLEVVNNGEVPDSQDDSAAADSVTSITKATDSVHTTIQKHDESASSVKDTTSPSKAAPSKAAFTEGTPTESMLNEDIPNEETPYEGTPVKGTPTKGTLNERTTPAKTSPSKPHTPRLTAIPTTKAPSSRRSVLSLVNGDSDNENGDELLGNNGSTFNLPRLLATASAHKSKTWKTTVRTTEVNHTPVKRCHRDAFSPESAVTTPGGTTRTCGVDGYRLWIPHDSFVSLLDRKE
ncbi:hypothetical protein ACO1O0_003225 [Amphichorda felina]